MRAKQPTYLVEDFFAERTFSEATRKMYEYHLQRLHAWLEQEELDVADLTPARFMAYLKAQTSWGDAARYQVLCAARAYIRWKFGPEHPLLRARLKRVEGGPQRTLTAAELEKLLVHLGSRAQSTRLRRVVTHVEVMTPRLQRVVTYVEETTPNPKAVRDLALVSFMVDTGYRSSEICRAALGDLDLERLTCSVVAKGGKWRRAVFSTVTRDRLIDWIAVRPQSSAPNLFLSIGGETPGRPLTDGGLRAIFRKMAQASGVAGLSPHVFRRTMATLAIRAGASTRLTQLLGGWSSPLLVERYTKVLTPEDAAPFLPTSTIGRKESVK